MPDENVTELHAAAVEQARVFLADTAAGGTLEILDDRAKRLLYSLEHLVEAVEAADIDDGVETFGGWSGGIMTAPDYPPAS